MVLGAEPWVTLSMAHFSLVNVKNLQNFTFGLLVTAIINLDKLGRTKNSGRQNLQPR
jgi:hypothetical protein